MSRFIARVIKKIFVDDSIDKAFSLPKIGRKSSKPLTQRELIQLESHIGAAIFGEKPEHVVRREFFNLDENTWIWHEEVLQENGKNQQLTTKYEIQPRGILKIQPNYKYSYLEGAELDNFVMAAKEYYRRIKYDIYSDVSGDDAKSDEYVLAK